MTRWEGHERRRGVLWVRAGKYSAYISSSWVIIWLLLGAVLGSGATLWILNRLP